MIEFDGKLNSTPEYWHNDRVHFFKYMSASTGKIVLRNQTFRWATASALNDPFEMQFDVGILADKNHIKQIVLERLWAMYQDEEPVSRDNAIGLALDYIRKTMPRLTQQQIFDRFDPAIDEGFAIIEANQDQNIANALPMFSKVKLLSLTVRPDNKLMWSHYADSHKGIVLRIRSIPAIGSPYGMARPVYYSDEVPAFFSEDFLIDSFCGAVTPRAKMAYDKVMLRKSSEWAYEQEWRVTGGTGRKPDEPFEDNNFGANEIDGIIWGVKTSDQDKAEIREYAENYPNIEFMQSSLVLGKSELDINVVAD